MWYYVKEKKKVGPISDAAIRDLFEGGTITKSTMVWSQDMPKWIKMGESSIYHKITAAPISNSLSILRSATYLLRVSLFALIAFMGVRIYYLLESYDFFKKIWTVNSNITDMADAIKLVELQHIIIFSRTFSWILIFLVGIVTMRWAYIIAHTSKSIDNEFKYSPYAAAFSFAIPFVNFILPCKIVVGALNASLYALRQKVSAFDIALIFTWWTCWIITIILFLIETFTSSAGLDNIQVSLCFSIFVIAMIAVTSLLFMLVATRIYSLQSKFFSNANNLRNKKSHIDARTF